MIKQFLAQRAEYAAQLRRRLHTLNLLHWLATRFPSAYRVGTLAVALLGYAYLLFFPALSLLLARNLPYTLGHAGTVLAWLYAASEIFLFLVALFFSTSLWRVRFAPPFGTALGADEAPELFALLDELHERYASPPIHRVVITDKFGLSVVRNPRHGFALSFDNTLVLGWPLLESLSGLQVKALLAREFGRLAGRESRLTAWLARVRRSWLLLAHPAAEAPHAARLLLRLWASWYVPLYTRITVPIARWDELEADRYALDLLNDRDVAGTMTASLVAECFLRERFWPQLFAAALHRATPPFLPYARMAAALRESLDPADVRRWLTEAGTATPVRDAPLPGLRERLEAIGHIKVRTPPALAENSAEILLGTSAATIRRDLDRDWLKRNLPGWKRRHVQAQREREHMRALQNKAQRNALSTRETWEFAKLVERHLGASAAIPLYKEMLKRKADSAKVNFTIGRWLLAQGDMAGLDALQFAMHKDPRYRAAGRRLLSNFAPGQRDGASHTDTVVRIVPDNGNATAVA